MKVGTHVICRSEKAGVYFGKLISQNGTVVELADASNLWRWSGANTLLEAAIHGVGEEYTRLSEPVPEIMITDVCAIIACSKTAIENLSRPRWSTD